MYTRNLRILHPDINEKQLQKTKCKFRKQFSKQIVLQRLKKDHYEIMKRKAWLKCKQLIIQVINILIEASGWFDWKVWQPVFQILDQAPVQRIYFSNYRNPDIIWDIVHVSFPKLRQLHLQDNLITSLEPLVALKIPNLRKLDIRRNLIMTITCLRSCQFPRLQEINLSDNQIKSCNCIAQCYFPDLKRIIIEEKTYLNIYMAYQQGRGQRQLKTTSSVNGYDLRWILKLQTKSVEYVKYSADQRIIRRQLQQQIGLKYYKIRVQKKGMEKGSLLPLMAF